MLSPESRRNNKLLELPTLMLCSLKSVSLQKFETLWNKKGTQNQHLYRSSWWRQWDNRKSCGETNFVHIFIPSVHFKQKSEVSAQKLSSQRLQRLFPILHEKGSFYSQTAIRTKQTQGPEEFRVNKWITYLSLTLKNVYTCRLARLISPMGSLWIYCKRFLPFLSDPDRLCCLPFWKSITASHLLAGARHVARRVTEDRRPKGNRGTKCRVSRSYEPSVSWFAVYRMCNETETRSK